MVWFRCIAVLRNMNSFVPNSVTLVFLQCKLGLWLVLRLLNSNFFCQNLFHHRERDSSKVVGEHKIIKSVLRKIREAESASLKLV
jgi:hypothetical protein